MNRNKAVSVAVLASVLALSQMPVQAAEPLGTVTGTAQGSSGFFGSSPNVNTGETPPSDVQQIQKFKQDTTNAETTITRGQYEMLTPTDSYTQSLQNLPNAVVVSSGDSMDGDDVYINGFSKSLINFTLDGIPLNDNDSYTYYSNEFIPSVLVAGTKYYPGAQSAAIPGLASFGGSIETYSLKPSPYFFLRPMVGGGSFGKYNYGGLVNTGLFLKNIAPTSAWLYVNTNHRDGYFQNNGAIQTQFLFKSVTQIGPGALTLFFTQNNQRFNYYNGATAAQIAQFGNDYNGYTSNPFLANGRPNTFYTGYNYNRYLNWLGYGKYEGEVGKVKFSEQFYYYYGNGYGAGATTFTQTLLTPAGSVQRVAPAADQVLLRNSINNTHRWGNIVKLAYPLGPVDTELGFWFNHNNTTHDAQYFNQANVYLGSTYIEPVVTDTYEPYIVFNYKPVERLKLAAGVKYLYANRDFKDYVALAQGQPGVFNASFHQVLPSVGANYRVMEGINLFANFTQNANPPGYNQFYTGVYNPSLAPQKANTYDLGLVWNRGFWKGELDLFRVDFRNYILSTTVQVGSFNQTVLANAGKAINQGISWQNNFVFNDQLSAYANVGFLDARLKSAGQPFPYAPHHTESVGLIYRDGGFKATVGFNEIGNAYYNLGGKFLPLGSRFYTNASLRYTLNNMPLSSGGFGLKKVSLGVYVNNLFDRTWIQSYSGSNANPNLKLNLPANVYATLDASF
ncbi:TonB-dependent receptor [Acidithiobacillus caldus]|uniref:TonB-dependent receptor n=1 Tax=Acidithiobacillus caldus TaxID=33059 RepID=UPI000A56FBA6|nr:TonB-dependent receptor [Acidithiobacillus caldus]